VRRSSGRSDDTRILNLGRVFGEKRIGHFCVGKKGGGPLRNEIHGGTSTTKQSNDNTKSLVVAAAAGAAAAAADAAVAAAAVPCRHRRRRYGTLYHGVQSSYSIIVTSYGRTLRIPIWPVNTKRVYSVHNTTYDSFR